jgi:hypothetical protein
MIKGSKECKEWQEKSVTWLVNMELKEYFWGHYYFDDLRVALEDFEKRN